MTRRELPTSVGAVIGTRHRTNEGWLVGLAVCGAGVVVVHLDETRPRHGGFRALQIFTVARTYDIGDVPITIPFARTISASG